jgi:hypothetical protein
LCAGALAISAGACLPSLDNLDRGPLNGSFAVSDFYTPSGYMGDGARLGLLSATTNEGCKPRPAGARGNCYAFTYYANLLGQDPWAGVFWVFPANNWGSSFGHAIDSKRFTHVRFYVAIEAPVPYTVRDVPQYLSAFSGRIDPRGFYDSIGLKDHKDALDFSVDLEVGSQIGRELKQFRMPLSDFDKTKNCVPDEMGNPPRNCTDGYASDLIGAFGWAVHYPNDGDPTLMEPVKIYLDDIVWDTAEVPAP